jgi:peptidoglycan/LPS O-acetylase OafA/YrhL
VTIPIFVYCLQEKTTERKPLSWIYLIVLYAILLAGIFFKSDSLKSSKMIYSVCAIVFFLISFTLTPAIRQILLKAGVFLGFISYALYMIHYPLVRFVGSHLGSFNCFLAVVLLVPCIIGIAYFLERASKAIFFRKKNRLKPQGLPVG